MKDEREARCDHLGIVTENAERMLEFYVGKLGFEVERDEVLPAAIAQEIFETPYDHRFVRLVRDGVKVELFEPVQEEGGNEKVARGGYHHWGLVTGDREGLCERLKEGGREVIELVRKNGHVVCFATDPDGNLIEIR